MSSKKMEENIAAFDRLIVKAALIHPRTWCVARQVPVWTRSLRGRECWLCGHFVVNGGVCDPL